MSVYLCLSCCQRMEHGYCQACWEQQSRAVYEHLTRNAEPLEIIDPPTMVDLETLLAGVTDEHIPRPCAWCGQRHERGSGRCACWSEQT